MRKKMWVYCPRKQKKDVSKKTKMLVQQACDQLVAEYFLPRFVKDFDPRNKKTSQCVGVQLKWYRHFFYIKAVYRDLRPDVISETYEYPIARLECVDTDLYYLAYFRHTGEWSDITSGVGCSLQECIALIQSFPHFTIL